MLLPKVGRTIWTPFINNILENFGISRTQFFTHKVPLYNDVIFEYGFVNNTFIS